MLLAPKRYISNVVGLQVINTLRFVTFLIVSIVFTKIGLSKEEIGLFEISLFIVSAANFFWITGIIQGFLPLYKGSATYGDLANENGRKSPEIFNVYIVLIVFSLIVFFIGKGVQNHFSVFGYSGKVPLLNVTLWYLLLSSPACLVEYIYMLRDQSGNTLSYAYITFTAQLVAVLAPAIMGYGVIWSLRGLVFIALIRNIWLFTLIYNYAEIKISVSFLKELLVLAVPLILSTMISGSAQYIDGIIVSSKEYAEKFAEFRFGAKELPFVVMLAAGLHGAMLTEFSAKENIKDTLYKLKKKSLRIMHLMYPLSIVMLFFAKPLYWFMFSKDFTRSADVFVVYLLAIVSRLLFPHTIIIGMRKTKVLLWVSVMELALNLALSLWFYGLYGIVGVALATVVVYLFTRFVLIGYNYHKFNIKPWEYIPIGWYLGYSILLGFIFVLLDREIIDLPF